MPSFLKNATQITGSAQVDAKTCVNFARTWLGTRYQHQGRRKKNEQDRGGVDCLGLLMGIAGDLSLVDKHGLPLVAHDHRIYSKQPDADFMKQCLRAAMEEKPFSALQPSDVILLEMDGNAQHVGLCVQNDIWGAGELGIIHAYAPARGVVEHRLDDAWKARVCACFTLIGE